MYKYTIFKTPFGYTGLVVSVNGLHMVILPKEREGLVKRELEAHYTSALIRDDKALASIAKKFKDYYAGKKIVFKVKFDAEGATPYEIKVWDSVFGIPYGEVRSYNWLAGRVGSAANVRSVGQALKRNRLPIVIPCHRIIRKSGDLGGYSGGVELKRQLLNLEGRIW